jgi:hypothetical protein
MKSHRDRFESSYKSGFKTGFTDYRCVDTEGCDDPRMTVAYAILVIVETYCPGINSDNVTCGRGCCHEG